MIDEGVTGFGLSTMVRCMWQLVFGRRQAEFLCYSLNRSRQEQKICNVFTGFFLNVLDWRPERHIPVCAASN